MAVLLLLSHCVLLDIDTLGMYEGKSFFIAFCTLHISNETKEKATQQSHENMKTNLDRSARSQSVTSLQTHIAQVARSGPSTWLSTPSFS